MKRVLVVMMILMGFAASDALAKKAKANPADTDKDGKISKTEYLAKAKKDALASGKEFNAKGYGKAFNKSDADKDGFLTGLEQFSPKQKAKIARNKAAREKAAAAKAAAAATAVVQ